MADPRAEQTAESDRCGPNTPTIADFPACLSFPVADPKSGHVSCCVNEDVSLCAQDISALPVRGNDGPSGCRVCDYLDETTSCPLGLICGAGDD